MKRAALLLLVFACALAAVAQNGARTRRRSELNFFYEGGQINYVEAVNLAADDRGQSRVMVNFRVAYDALTFQRTGGPGSASSTYTAFATARAELLDEREVTVQRASWRDTVVLYTYGETNDNTRFLSGAMMLDVPPGKYTLAYTFEDGVSRQAVREYRPRLVLRDFRRSPQISSPLFCSWADSLTAQPVNLGGSMEFGTGCRVLLDAAADVRPAVRYLLLRLHNGRDSTIVRTGEFTVSDGIQLAVRDGKCCAESRGPAWRYQCGLAIPGDSLDVGDYVLRVSAQAGTDTSTGRFPFRVIWSAQPLSLFNTDYAIEAMRYILTDGQLDSLRSGNAQERKAQFDAWWAAQDPTPGTIFNERKAEYFRRVDHAFYAFRNGAKEDDDGSRHDRGKIYILYGAPTSIDRALLPDGPAQEIWTYLNNVKKRFVFVDNDKAGNYRLASVEDLK